MKAYRDLTEEEKKLYGFEHFCGSCDFFKTPNCPHFGKVTEGTMWNEADTEDEIVCDNFLD